jgi:hypothetical protein
VRGLVNTMLGVLRGEPRSAAAEHMALTLALARHEAWPDNLPDTPEAVGVEVQKLVGETGLPSPGYAAHITTKAQLNFEKAAVVDLVLRALASLPALAPAVVKGPPGESVQAAEKVVCAAIIAAVLARVEDPSTDKRARL